MADGSLILIVGSKINICKKKSKRIGKHSNYRNRLLQENVSFFQRYVCTSYF